MTAAAASATAPTTAALSRNELIVVAAHRGKAGDEAADIAAGAGSADHGVRLIAVVNQRVERCFAILTAIFIEGHGFPFLYF